MSSPLMLTAPFVQDLILLQTCSLPFAEPLASICSAPLPAAAWGQLATGTSTLCPGHWPQRGGCHNKTEAHICSLSLCFCLIQGCWAQAGWCGGGFSTLCFTNFGFLSKQPAYLWNSLGGGSRHRPLLAAPLTDPLATRWFCTHTQCWHREGKRWLLVHLVPAAPDQGHFFSWYPASLSLLPHRAESHGQQAGMGCWWLLPSADVPALGCNPRCLRSRWGEFRFLSTEPQIPGPTCA